MTAADFEALVREHGRKVFNVAYRICGSREDAEDAVQEGFARAWKAAPAFRADSAPSTWLYRIVVNEALRRKGGVSREYVASLARASDELQEQVPDEVRGVLNDPAEQVVRDEMVRTIREACFHFASFTLTPEQRAVYLLRVSFGFTNEEVAQICETSVGTVKARLHRARHKLVNVFFRECRWLHPNGTCSCEKRFGIAFAMKPDLLRAAREIAETGKGGESQDSVAASHPDIDALFRSVREAEFDPARVRFPG